MVSSAITTYRQGRVWGGSTVSWQGQLRLWPFTATFLWQLSPGKENCETANCRSTFLDEESGSDNDQTTVARCEVKQPLRNRVGYPFPGGFAPKRGRKWLCLRPNPAGTLQLCDGQGLGESV